MSDEIQTVLVVDDSVDNIKILMTILKSECKVVFAKSGLKAIELAKQHQPDLILLDVVMPEIDGYETCLRLKADEETSDIPIIFITGCDKTEDEVKGLTLGGVDYIMKPVVNEVVLARVKTHLELVRARKLLRYLSDTDGLTGLFNRRTLDKRLEIEVRRCFREQQELSIILIDIDFFKKYNDHYGHQPGDDCLQKVALAIKNMPMRPSDFVARYGGEEFMIVLPNSNAEGIEKISRLMHETIHALKLEHVASETRYLTISAGAGTFKLTAESTVAELIEKVDDCLYQAKESGRNQSVFIQESNE